MNDIKTMEEGFSEIIPNKGSKLITKEGSNQIRREHNRWRNEVYEMKNEKEIEELSYWQVQSSCVAL